MKQILRLPALAVAATFRLYQVTISPLTGPSCRYYPCCSSYGITSLKRHGLWRGLALTAWRILRCNPWSRGGVDHVPRRVSDNTLLTDPPRFSRRDSAGQSFPLPSPTPVAEPVVQQAPGRASSSTQLGPDPMVFGRVFTEKRFARLASSAVEPVTRQAFKRFGWRETVAAQRKRIQLEKVSHGLV